jgi:valyl-tRNA synthetase
MGKFADSYQFKEVEERQLENWLTTKVYQVNKDTNSTRETFSIALPPPNVTGELHMGHALSGTIQDMLLRYHRMLGHDVHWQIGSDHAGIGTQLVVEKHLKKTEHKRKEEYGRTEFIKRVKEWKEEYGNKIVKQMQRMGFSPDYERVRYTMDDDYTTEVKDSFVKYFNEGLIYRGKRLSNWCPKCLTSISDLEIDEQEKVKTLYEISYKLTEEVAGLSELVVATTRPETMFGDTAVAINPADTRYTALIEKLKQEPESVKALIPLIDKPISIVLDEYVKLDFGTGALKVTPAHDFNDNEIGKRHDLEELNIFDQHAKLLDIPEVPDTLKGLDRYEARTQLCEILSEKSLLIKTSEYSSSENLHDRCGTEIEPFLSDQWYLKMSELAEKTLKTVCEDKNAVFTPARYTDLFKAWLENIQDWCISRQIWWGHRIPVFYYEDQGKLHYFASKDHDAENLPTEDPTRLDASGAAYDISGLKVYQDEDVLDTWFSSALWPYAAMNDDQQVQDKYFPTSILATAREIINLWVTRMIFSAEYFKAEVPFKDILIHPVVQTPDGKRMSKSKGNAIDPLELIEKYGADASRMWYASVGVLGNQDVRFPGKKNKKTGWECETIDKYKKFNNKIYNAAKFVLMSIENAAPASEFKPLALSEILKLALSSADRWILSKFDKTLTTIESAYNNYDLGLVQSSLFEFIWHDFCDWYLELSKIQTNQQAKNQVLFYVLEACLRALQPITPFVSAEISQLLLSQIDSEEFLKEIYADYISKQQLSELTLADLPLAHASFPRAAKLDIITAEDLAKLEFTIELTRNLRNARQSLDIPWSKRFNVLVLVEDQLASDFKANLEFATPYILELVKVDQVSFTETEPAKPVNTFIFNGAKVFIPLAGMVDLEKLRNSLENKINKVNKDINSLDGRLKSENFVSKAPADKIEEARAELIKLQKEQDLFQNELNSLQAT